MQEQSVSQLYTVIKDFKARLGDELTISKGDAIELISDDREYGDGWYMGKNLRTGKVGLYPKVFTREKTTNGTVNRPSLLRSRSRRFTPQGNSPLQNQPEHLTGVPEESLLHQIPSKQQQSLTTISQNSNNSQDSHVSEFTRKIRDLERRTQLESQKEFSGGSGNQLNSKANGSRDVASVYTSVHKALNDIDKALAELNIDEDAHPDSQENLGNSSGQDANSPLPLNPEEVENWSPEDVSRWFLDLGFDSLSAGQFATHKINGEILIQMELAYLKELDITSFGTRFEMYKEIEELRLQAKKRRSSVAPNHPDTEQNIPARMVETQQSFTNTSPSISRAREFLSGFSESTPTEIQRSSGFASTPALRMDGSRASSLISQPRRQLPRSASQPVGGFQTKKQSEYKSRLDPRNGSDIYLSGVGMSSSSLDLVQPGHARTGSFGQTSSIYDDANDNTERDTGMSKDTYGTSDSEIESSSSFSFAPSSSKKEQSALHENSLQQDPQNDPEMQNTKQQETFANDRIQNERRTVSAKEHSSQDLQKDREPAGKRIMSATAALRSLTQYRSSKMKTSAFQEGIRQITPDSAAKKAECSGWMFKRGNLSIGSWKQRFFVLNKTRLAYFASMKDKREKGLIDITSHKVLPAIESEDKVTAAFAATAGFGRYCFKLVPPAPGSKKGLTFTQQKVHYFAVDSKDEMRKWMAALMKATIEMDDTVPVISSCMTPTIPLQRAQELLQEARKNANTNIEIMKKMKEREKGSLFGGDGSNSQQNASTDSGSVQHSFQNSGTSSGSVVTTPTSDAKSSKRATSTNGMSTPYLVTSGLMSPNAASGVNNESPQRPSPIITKLDNDMDLSSPGSPGESTPHSSTSLKNAMDAVGRRVMSLRRSSK